MENEPENPVVYLSKLIKKLDVKKQEWDSGFINSQYSSYFIA